MREYRTKWIESKSMYYVIETETGASIQYHNSMSFSRYAAIPSYKQLYFVDWYVLTKSQRKEIHLSSMKYTIPVLSQAPATVIDDIIPNHPVSFGSVTVQATAQTPAPNPRNKKMCYDCEDYGRPTSEAETADKQRDYLIDRLYSTASEKKDEARKAFNIENMAAPEDAIELVKRIKDGLYVVDEDAIKSAKKDRWFYAGPFFGLKWRDPAKPADEDGYEKTRDAINAAEQKAQDEIKIFSPEKGLETLRAFEAATFH